MNIEELLIRHEGVRHKMYRDSLGVPTIGVGHNLTKPLSDRAIDQILRDDIEDARSDCAQFPWFVYLDSVRQAVVLDMVFNMGVHRFKGFRNTIGHIQAGQYNAAAMEMLDSVWANQVGRRADELAEMMRSGEWPNA